MDGEQKYDDMLLNILKEEGQIISFLDVVFGFLRRRTDFYIVRENPTSKIGFPPDIAENAVRGVFKKWQKSSAEVKNEGNVLLMEDDMSDLVIHEEEVVTTNNLDSPEEVEPINQSKPIVEKSVRADDLSGDTYNGADCGSYRWSQTALEVDVKVLVPGSIVKSSQVRVDIQACQLSVSVCDPIDGWNTLVQGHLCYKHLTEESIWTLLPCKQITIHLQKAGETWWDSLLTSETKLDLAKLDVSKHMSDLPEEDHMQVQKVMLEEERKRLGLPPTGHQENLDILKEAWDLEGSPFRGTPFDPSVLQLPSQ